MSQYIDSSVIGIGIVFNKQGEILIDKRLSTNTIMPEMWEFPGGKQRKDELIEITIQREIEEELAIKVKICDQLLEFDYIYNKTKLHFVVHICEWESGNPRPLASVKFLWVAPQKLTEYNFPPANVRILSTLKNYLYTKKNSTFNL